MFEKLSHKFWNWFLRCSGISDLRNKQMGTQKHCHILDDRLKIIEKMVSVGVDVHPQSESWVVFSLAGRRDFVEFYQLPAHELKYLVFMMRQLEKRYGKMNVDASMGTLEEFRL